ncbi:Lrp/AsnC family transcriptional regulator [Hyphococcus luteus]|uniref:AsnC family transcriptional regulator n=1 Tax=Hyphococcus luteus TaxID=2058213 RepID=A0A2S7K314_9PROT|nr:Lrp/AsnC family transcriptional regulator [Marinicaulis flavus]PQA86889.1 AsnC family transcriptional regulator [Marinicaulis flavus]
MIDESDKKILDLLQRDGRLTNAEIADRVGLSVSAAHRRVKQLEAEGVITGYSAKVDRSAAGLNVLAYIFVKLDFHTEEHLAIFEKQVNLIDEVVSCSAISGAAGDYILQVVARDMDAFAEVALKKLVRLPGVKDSSSNFVLSTMKQSAGWPLSI